LSIRLRELLVVRLGEASFKRLRPLLPDKVRGFAGVNDRWVICATPVSGALKACAKAEHHGQ
jgi:hypothetical protein